MADSRLILFYRGAGADDRGRLLSELQRQSLDGARSEVWLRPHNHNFLRITRILRSLSLLGCEPQAAALFAWLRHLYDLNPTLIGSQTFGYWQKAVAGA